MKIKDQQIKMIILTVSLIAIGLIIVSSLLVISKTFESTGTSITLEMTEKAINKLIDQYGEENFQMDKPLLQILHKDLNIYKESRFFKEGLKKLAEYQDMIYDVLDKNSLSRHYIYVAFVESQYNPEAYNKKSGAKGMWQLIPETAKSFGLRVNESVDERYDPVKSTVAAVRYLKYLQDMYGIKAFPIVLAAYNAGEGTILNSAKKLDSTQLNLNFWKLYKDSLIPGQTKAFVMRVITFLILAEGLV